MTRWDGTTRGGKPGRGRLPVVVMVRGQSRAARGGEARSACSSSCQLLPRHLLSPLAGPGAALLDRAGPLVASRRSPVFQWKWGRNRQLTVCRAAPSFLEGQAFSSLYPLELQTRVRPFRTGNQRRIFSSYIRARPCLISTYAVWRIKLLLFRFYG